MSSIMSDVFLIGSCITVSVTLGVVLGIVSYVHLRQNPFPDDGDIEGYYNKILGSMCSPQNFAPDLNLREDPELEVCAAFWRCDCLKPENPEPALVADANGMCGDTATSEKVPRSL